MAINQVLEPFNSQPRVFNQTYLDLTFVLGPPNGERYDMLVGTARLNGDSFSKVYRTYIEEVFASFEEKTSLMMLSHVFLERILKPTIFFQPISSG